MTGGQRIITGFMLLGVVIAILTDRYYYPVNYWLERGSMVLLFGAVVGVVLFLFWQGLRTRQGRSEAAKEAAVALRQYPLKSVFEATFMICFFMFFGGLFLSALGWEPILPVLEIRVWTAGICGVAALMVVGFITGWM